MYYNNTKSILTIYINKSDCWNCCGCYCIFYRFGVVQMIAGHIEEALCPSASDSCQQQAQIWQQPRKRRQVPTVRERWDVVDGTVHIKLTANCIDIVSGRVYLLHFALNIWMVFYLHVHFFWLGRKRKCVLFLCWSAHHMHTLHANQHRALSKLWG